MRRAIESSLFLLLGLSFVAGPAEARIRRNRITILENGDVKLDKDRLLNVHPSDRIIWEVVNNSNAERRVSLANFYWRGTSGGDDQCENPQPGPDEERHYRDPLRNETVEKAVTVPRNQKRNIDVNVRRRFTYLGCYKYDVFLDGKMKVDPELELDEDDGDEPPLPPLPPQNP